MANKSDTKKIHDAMAFIHNAVITHRESSGNLVIHFGSFRKMAKVGNIAKRDLVRAIRDWLQANWADALLADFGSGYGLLMLDGSTFYLERLVPVRSDAPHEVTSTSGTKLGVYSDKFDLWMATPKKLGELIKKPVESDPTDE